MFTATVGIHSFSPPHESAPRPPIARAHVARYRDLARWVDGAVEVVAMKVRQCTALLVMLLVGSCAPASVTVPRRSSRFSLPSPVLVSAPDRCAHSGPNALADGGVSCEVPVEPPSVHEIIAGIEARYRRVERMSAWFHHELWTPSNTVPDTNAGRLLVAKPGRWRLEYLVSPRLEFVCDGNVIGVGALWQSAGRTIAPLTENGFHDAFRVFWDRDGFGAHFEARLLESPRSARGQRHLICLVPRSRTGWTVTMLVDAETFFVVELVVASRSGLSRRFIFDPRRTVENNNLPAALFVP